MLVFVAVANAAQFIIGPKGRGIPRIKLSWVDLFAPIYKDTGDCSYAQPEDCYVSLTRHGKEVQELLKELCNNGNTYAALATREFSKQADERFASFRATLTRNEKNDPGYSNKINEISRTIQPFLEDCVFQGFELISEMFFGRYNMDFEKTMGDVLCPVAKRLLHLLSLSATLNAKDSLKKSRNALLKRVSDWMELGGVETEGGENSSSSSSSSDTYGGGSEDAIEDGEEAEEEDDLTLVLDKIKHEITRDVKNAALSASNTLEMEVGHATDAFMCLLALERVSLVDPFEHDYGDIIKNILRASNLNNRDFVDAVQDLHILFFECLDLDDNGTIKETDRLETMYETLAGKISNFQFQAGSPILVEALVGCVCRLASHKMCGPISIKIMASTLGCIIHRINPKTADPIRLMVIGFYAENVYQHYKCLEECQKECFGVSTLRAAMNEFHTAMRSRFSSPLFLKEGFTLRVY